MQLSVQNIYSNEEKTQIINLFTSEFPGDKQLLNSKFDHIINLHPNLTSIICKNTSNEIQDSVLRERFEDLTKYFFKNIL